MTRTLARVALFVFALTLSLSAFAATKSDTVTLYHDAQINGKTLPAGEYQVKCETTGSTAQVKFMKSGKEVASGSGQVKPLTATPEHTQVITTGGGSGAAMISEIDFGHSNSAVSFDERRDVERWTLIRRVSRNVRVGTGSVKLPFFHLHEPRVPRQERRLGDSQFPHV